MGGGSLMAYMALVLLLIFIAIMLLGIPVGFGMGALRSEERRVGKECRL